MKALQAKLLGSEKEFSKRRGISKKKKFLPVCVCVEQPLQEFSSAVPPVIVPISKTGL